MLCTSSVQETILFPICTPVRWKRSVRRIAQSLLPALSQLWVHASHHLRISTGKLVCKLPVTFMVHGTVCIISDVYTAKDIAYPITCGKQRYSRNRGVWYHSISYSTPNQSVVPSDGSVLRLVKSQRYIDIQKTKPNRINVARSLTLCTVVQEPIT